ncbi:HAD-IIB family hydrolase [Rossellomorea vietnamensis]|uniref:HAD-IIB family hydrolase n=1 Tax=Rossellomorea vietnamensis TaxID=218284 RepID=A0A6I6UMG7_9BACI|nr:HAD-IIB family hydrolase [Rossellomorea vietnamensis]QHE59812.1 HAD-IIB family hydrolase [Rossellomorea vietnamensis]
MNIDPKFRTAVFDIDGTLIDRKESLFKGVLEGLKMLKAHGIKLFIATGRNTQSIRDLHLTEEFFELFNQSFICNDGNTLYNYKSGELQIINSIPNSVVYSIIDSSEDETSFIIESNGKIYSSSKEALIKYKLIYRTPRDLITILDIEELKLLDGLTELHLFSNNTLDLEEILTNHPTLSGYSINHFGGIKLFPNSSCKAKGISNALLPLGISLQEVIAFGDGENDETMLQNCGLGVAVKGCKSSLLRKADISLKDELEAYLQEWIKVLRSSQ